MSVTSVRVFKFTECRCWYFETNSLPISMRLKVSVLSLCSCNMARELNRFCIMVERCQLFNLLDNENGLSADALVDGLTRRSMTTRAAFRIILVSVGKFGKCLMISSKHTTSIFKKRFKNRKLCN